MNASCTATELCMAMLHLTDRVVVDGITRVHVSSVEVVVERVAYAASCKSGGKQK